MAKKFDFEILTDIDVSRPIGCENEKILTPSEGLFPSYRATISTVFGWNEMG